MVPEGTLAGPGPDAGGSGSRSSGAGLGPRAPGRPRALLPFASLGALAEVLLPALPLWAPRLGVPGALAGPGSVRSARRVGHGLGEGCGVGKRAPAEGRASGRCYTHGTQALPLVRKRPTSALHLWGTGCAGIAGWFQGKGLDAGGGGCGGRGRDCSSQELFTGALSAAPHFLFGRCTWEKSVDGAEGAWPGLAAPDPREEVSGLCSFVAGPVGRGREVAGLLRLEAAPEESRWEEGRGRTCQWLLRAGEAGWEEDRLVAVFV